MRTPSTPRPRRALVALVAGALLATAATACEPPVPPPAFTVDTLRNDPDADPGDGACATAEGECSLLAAIDEANATGTPTDVTVPQGEVDAVPVEVTGVVTIVASGPYLNLGHVPFTVAEGGQLTVTDAAIAAVEVEGSFSARRVVVEGGGFEPAVQVGPNGRAILANTSIGSMESPAARNAGTLVLHSTTLGTGRARLAAVPAVTTLEGGLTRLSATMFVAGQDPNPACGGVAPVSDGYNLAPDTSCGLTATGDRQDVVEPSPAPSAGSARVDAVPAGVLFCGDGWDDDLFHGDTPVRPADGDGDSTPACDVGAVELLPR
jgi:hypothetical protein